MNASKVFFAVALIALSACTQSVKTSDDGKTTTVTNGNSTVTVGQGVDTSNLGAPVYPGAATSGAASVANTTGGGTYAGFKTNDDFDKVYEFYKSNLPAGSEKMKSSAGDTNVAMFSTTDASGASITVQISSEKAAETTIVITHADKTDK